MPRLGDVKSLFSRRTLRNARADAANKSLCAGTSIDAEKSSPKAERGKR